MKIHIFWCRCKSKLPCYSFAKLVNISKDYNQAIRNRIRRVLYFSIATIAPTHTENHFNVKDVSKPTTGVNGLEMCCIAIWFAVAGALEASTSTWSDWVWQGWKRENRGWGRTISAYVVLMEQVQVEIGCAFVDTGLPSANISTTSATESLVLLDFFLWLGFLPSFSGPLPRLISNTFGLFHERLYHWIKLVKVPATWITARSVRKYRWESLNNFHHSVQRKIRL